MAAPVSDELRRLGALGIEGDGLIALLELLDDREGAVPAGLVWSGPEGLSARTRDTGVTVRQLFERAQVRVVVAGFAVYQGKTVFKVLAERMDANPALAVDMYLNVERKYRDTTVADDLLKRFAEKFRGQEWPGLRLPRVYYDPRSLQILQPTERRAVLHAKCIAVDGRHVLVTSANFTEAAQERNVEVGVVLDDVAMASSLEEQFGWLVANGHLARVPGL